MRFDGSIKVLVDTVGTSSSYPITVMSIVLLSLRKEKLYYVSFGCIRDDA